MNANDSKLESIITDLAVDAERYPISRPTDPHQSVPNQEVFILYLQRFAEALAEIEERLYRIEHKLGQRE